ncbi:Transketolase C-terminal/Pyruvate-ferredoxin oxidoreductase domain II [Penicillium cf. griseofulvum]|uniref:Transketolase C-terminal/Pyruvate-ferredoxin oxidoreductase domain II n=1 Tax=Penicillium cf. griseofulvum TaxID=2972120 RepID=A0A9W9JLX4_9EURO|nr:Transketolase C-terminal/Pyruvate-ferredoxin oxidoreductase domain II [Penicillium cf. griseofulvum]KAJ5442091.1 Transketolase C-terminal/Pyruvate-ferredoxin oxidoreductase domain II [Penicillium cf. griseofulvum]
MSGHTFPVDLKQFKQLKLDPKAAQLSPQQKSDLQHNINVFRDAIIAFTATGSARGVAGHTGGPFDTAPEVCILLGFMNGNPNKWVDALYDEAGHRVATQYLLAALDGKIEPDHLLQYRAADSHLPGHPELGFTPGIKFSSGRLGHMWGMVNGIAMANRDKHVILLGSDGSQQEGNDAEAARIAVANNLNVKLFIDNNDVTIAGHPSQYLKGYQVAQTLDGHGLKVLRAQGENLDSLYDAMCKVINHDGPAAVVIDRKMAAGIEGIEGECKAHDVIPVEVARKYLTKRGYSKEQLAFYDDIKPGTNPHTYKGSTKDKGSNRNIFGEAVNGVLDKLSKEEAKRRVMVIDSDLAGSTGLKAIGADHPEAFVASGVMERGNFSAAAGFGFGSNGERQGVFSTFSAFLEMCISEITMARLNDCTVLSHFSHSGVDEMADNTCHFGLNHFFADNGLMDAESTALYFPADGEQMKAVVNEVFWNKGLRFIFSTRSKVPYILKEGTDQKLFGEGYKFVPGKEEIIRKGSAGYIVSYGDMLYRSLDAVENLRAEGLDIGLINKPTLNVVDEETIKVYGSSPFVLVVESIAQKTGLGSRLGTQLLERKFTPKFKSIGAIKEGCGGLYEQINAQGLGPSDIIDAVKEVSGN